MSSVCIYEETANSECLLYKGWGMKLLHLADLHIGKRVYEYSMLEEQKRALTQAVSMAIEQEVDVVLIAGDVYDKSVPSIEGVKLLDSFLTALSEKNIPVFFISGNHDCSERLSFGKRLLETAGIYVSGAYEQQIQRITLSDCYGEVNFYLLPFMKLQQIEVLEGEEVPKDYTQAIQLLLNRLSIDTTKRNILLAHQFVGGVGINLVETDSETKSVGGLDSIDYRIFDIFDYVALGHLHKAQQVGRETVRYAGSPIKYSFSEARHVKSAALVTIKEKGTIKIEKLPFTPLHDMREIKGTLKQLTQDEVVKAADREDYMHITLTDEEEIYDVFGKIRAVYPNVMLLDFDNTRTRAKGVGMVTEQAIQTYGTLELFREFFLKQTGSAMEETQEKMVQDILEEL